MPRATCRFLLHGAAAKSVPAHESHLRAGVQSWASEHALLPSPSKGCRFSAGNGALMLTGLQPDSGPGLYLPRAAAALASPWGYHVA